MLIPVLEFLSHDGAPVASVRPGSDMQLLEGSISIGSGDGCRRTGWLKLSLPEEAWTQTAVTDGKGLETAVDGALHRLQRMFYVSIAFAEYSTQDGSICECEACGQFAVLDPGVELRPGSAVASMTLADKWALLDGTAGGTLDGDLLVPAGSSMCAAMSALLAGYDSVPPLIAPQLTSFTAPHDLMCAAGSTVAEAILAMAGVMDANVGYNAAGRLCLEPTGDLPQGFPTALTEQSAQVFSADVTLRTRDIYNDIVVVGATENYRTYTGRATETGAASPAAVALTGRRTLYLSMPDYYSDELCAAYARRRLRDFARLQHTVRIGCSREGLRSSSPGGKGVSVTLPLGPADSTVTIETGYV